jgi:flagellar hook-associated protein 1 FlgK
MSLIGALTTGQTALAASQAGIQVAGNNISNSGNADYTRETVQLTPATDQQIRPGMFVGNGVDITAIQRQADAALQSRLNNSISDGQSAQTTQQWLSQVQSVFNALGTSNLSASMTTFFNGWSTLANSPQDNGQRQVVLQQGNSLAQQFNSQRQQLGAINLSVSGELSSQVQAADHLASQIAKLNGQVVAAQGGASGTANALLDQRDATVKQLSQLMNVSTVQQPNGSVSVYVGSEPLVTNTVSNGVKLQNQDVNGTVTPTVVFKSNNGAIPLGGGGQIGALSDVQARITGVVGQEDTLAHNLIFELNKVYSSGQGLQGYGSLSASNTVTDTTKPLTSAAAGLTFTPNNGSFVVHLTDKTTGQTTSTLVQVNLTGSPADTTLDSLTASINAIAGVNATDTGGTLQIAATGGNQEISFSQDSSGALAALGVNTYFTGTDSSDIAVNKTLVSQPQMLAAAKNGDPADNQTALAIASMASQPVVALNGTSLDDTYQAMITGIATQTATAQSNAQAATAVQNTLQAQRDSVSGVSLDEEAINLIKQQQAYQGAARLINVVNQLMQTLIGMTQ